MRTIGWICLVIGVLGLLGSILGGRQSAFGPLFWIALGAYLLHRANTKEQESETRIIDPGKTQKENNQVLDVFDNPVLENKPLDINPLDINNNHNQQLESLEDIQAQLSLQQREAALCLISFFGGYAKTMDNASIRYLFKQAALFFGIPDSPMLLSQIMIKHADFHILINTITSIKPIKAREFLLLTCYDLVNISNSPEALEYFDNLANNMGYNKKRMQQLWQFYRNPT